MIGRDNSQPAHSPRLQQVPQTRSSSSLTARRSHPSRLLGAQTASSAPERQGRPTRRFLRSWRPSRPLWRRRRRSRSRKRRRRRHRWVHMGSPPSSVTVRRRDVWRGYRCQYCVPEETFSLMLHTHEVCFMKGMKRHTGTHSEGTADQLLRAEH